MLMADRKLRERERWLLAMLRSIGYGVVATDARWHVQFMNPVAESLTGWSAEQALGHELREILRVSISSPEPMGSGPGGLRGGQAQGLLVCRDGSEIPIEESSAVIRDDSGKVIGSVITLRELTSRTSGPRN